MKEPRNIESGMWRRVCGVLSAEGRGVEVEGAAT